MITNYDKLKNNKVVLYYGLDGIRVTVEELVQYLNQPIQILDKVEKRYIRNIIAPFWKSVKYVKKESDDSGKYYYIVIAYNDETIFTTSYLPPFDINSEMYTNMEVDRQYTLEELDIKFK